MLTEHTALPEQSIRSSQGQPTLAELGSPSLPAQNAAGSQTTDSSRVLAEAGAHSPAVGWPRTRASRLQREHLRFHRMRARAGALHCFLVDCSSSMALARQLASAKGLLMQLIHSAYQQRAEVAIIGFAGASAKVHLPTTLARPLTSQHIEKWLRPIRAGGATPFAQGVTTASGFLTRAMRARPAQSRWIWLLTDGRTTESPERPAYADVAIVIDCEQQRIRLNRCVDIARRWNAHYRRLADYTLESHSEVSP